MRISGVVADSEPLHAICSLALTRWRSYQLAYPFWSWLGKTRERAASIQNASAAVFAYAASLLRRAFVGWAQAARFARTAQATAARVLFCMGAFKLNRAFYFWLALAKYLKHMKAAMSAIQV